MSKNKGNSKRKTAASSVSHILGGNFLSRIGSIKHLGYLLFLAGLAVFYIGNSYYAEKRVRKIEKLQKEVKELRSEYVSQKSIRMQNSRQSAIAKNLSSKGIKESMTPPVKLVKEKE